MPIWQIFHPPTAFPTPESKHALSKSITQIYTTPTSNLPAFYVSVYFIPVSPENMYIGGQPPIPQKPFIRFAIDHIAIRLPNSDAAYAATTAKIDRALKPHVEDKGYDWEYHVTETERRLWKINGMAPPEWGSEGEKRWREENRAVKL